MKELLLKKVSKNVNEQITLWISREKETEIKLKNQKFWIFRNWTKTKKKKVEGKQKQNSHQKSISTE